MKTHPYPSQQGFSLVELMVGLTIGLFVLLGVLLAYTQWDGFARTSSGKTDAQMTGTVAAFRLESELSSAGLGLGSAPAVGLPTTPDGGLGCVVAAFNSARTPPNFTFPVIPVEIIQGVPAGAPDTISVLSGTADIRTLHTRIAGTPGSFDQTLLKTPGGMVPGDKVVLVSDLPPLGARNCAMVEVTGSVDKSIVHTPSGAYTSFQTGLGVTATMNAGGGPALAANTGTAYNLGSRPQYNTWAITLPPTPPSLTVNRLFTLNAAGVNAPETVAEDVVNLQAMYGVDVVPPGARTGVVVEWLDALPVPADWTRVIAIKYAILSRSRQFEPPLTLSPLTWATAAAPTWNNTAGTAPPIGPIAFVMTDVSGPNMGIAHSGAPDNTNWQGYRYTVREGIIPLRNMLWGQRP